MQTSQESSGAIHSLFHQPMQQIEPYHLSHFQILNNNAGPDTGSQGTSDSFQCLKENFFTLESSPATEFMVCDSPSAISISSNRSPFSPQYSSQSCLSNPHHSPDNTFGSPVSGSSIINDGNIVENFLRELEVELLGPGSEIEDGSICSFNSVNPQAPSSITYDRLLQMSSSLDLSQLLVACAHAVSDGSRENVVSLMKVLENMVSVTGDPIQRLGAYMLEGLRARLLSSGSIIYKKLKCNEPTSSELMSYMHVLYNICPYYKFAYFSSNAVIAEAMENEKHIHIIDFLIAQGSQWVFLMKALARRPGGPPSIRITGVDDSNSAYARGGGLQLVGQRLAKEAKSCGVPFEFHAAGISGCEVEWGNLEVRAGEALAVNFPYMLHHMPDESVSTTNHRDRLLRLMKSLTPKVVTLVEQESNTNTSSFCRRFNETLEYYTAMFESIDAGRPREDKQRLSAEDKQRINAEEHCVARDIVNIIACEDTERVERHEPYEKWRFRLKSAGFTQYPLSNSVGATVYDMLKDYSSHYRLVPRDGALFLGWKNRPLVTSSAWR